MFDCKKYVHNPHQWFIMQQFFSLKNYFAQIKFFMFWNLSLKCALDIHEVSWQRFSRSLPFHFYEIYFDNTHARTFLLIFFRFQDVCFRFVFQSIKMMYPLGTTPFPSLWRHQMKCLLISERIFFLKLGSNTLTINACSTVNILRNGPSSARNIPIILSLLKFNFRSVYCWCSMDSFCRVRFEIGPL